LTPTTLYVVPVNCSCYYRGA